MEVRLSQQNEIIFYDGHCGLSHHAIAFLLRLDVQSVFRFAPVQGETFRTQTTAATRDALPDSMVVQTKDGDLLTGPAAWIYVLRKIGGAWRFVSAVMKAVPGPVSEFIYRLVARTRYWFFGRRKNLYPHLPDYLQSRFHR